MASVAAPGSPQKVIFMDYGIADGVEGLVVGSTDRIGSGFGGWR